MTAIASLVHTHDVLTTYIESTNQEWRKSAPPFVSSYVPAINPKLIEIGSAILLIRPYKVLPVTTKIFMQHRFFFLSFIFIAHFFCGLAGACMNPRNFY